MVPAFTAPLPPEVLMSSMQEVASAKSRQSVLDLFRLPVLRWRTCNLLVVKYAVLCTLPGTGLGGQYSGGNSPYSLMGYIPGLDRQLPQGSGA